MPDPEAIEPEQNILYKFKIEDISILHLGNIQSSLKPGQIEELSPVDVILLPAENTLIELELAQFIQKIEAKLIIPIDNPEESNKTTNFFPKKFWPYSYYFLCTLIDAKDLLT